jgi:hypothetical protein
MHSQAGAWNEETGRKTPHQPSGYHSGGACQAGLYEKQRRGCSESAARGLLAWSALREHRASAPFSLPINRDPRETA